MVSILSVCGMAVVCAAAVLPSVCSPVHVPPIPVQYSSVLQLVSCTVRCRVCGVWVVSVCLWCSRGGVSSVCSPLVVVVGGAIVDGGACVVVVGGMMMGGR